MSRINQSKRQSLSSLILTPTDFYKYATQPLWIWYDRFGDQSRKEELSEFALKLLNNGVLHEEDYIAGLQVSKVTPVHAEDALKDTLELMRQGAPLIYQGCIQVEHEGVVYRGRPDLLEKREGTSAFGDWYYAPIEIKWTSKVKTVHKRQLAFYAMILEKLQGYFPAEVGIINRHHKRLPVTLDEDDISETLSLSEQIINVMKGEKPELTITSTSKNSPWYQVALEEAEAKQDIALIYKLRSKSVAALREEGIRTLHDMATMNLSELPKISNASEKTLQRAKLQARALVENNIIPVGDIAKLPDTMLKIYFDIEGDPFIGVDYLFGFLVSGDSQHLHAKAQNVRFFEDDKYFVYFLAKQPEEEEAMWRAFLEWIAILPEEYTIYHYADYEQTHLKSLAEEYGSSDVLARFQSKLVDLRKVIEKAFVLPLYFYSIKDIAKSSFLNFKWRHQKAGGGQSVFWYERWLETGDNAILDDIIDYNEDDVRATERLFMYIKEEKAFQVKD